MAATTNGSFKINANAFAKCAPNITTNIRQCGTVTQCSAKPVTADELNSLYTKSGDFRIMDALFKHDIEIKMCEAVQNGLYDFFMANKVTVDARISAGSPGLLEVAPFIKARQFSPINNQYWKFTGGVTSGGNWAVTVQSSTNIPADTASFPPKMRLMLHGKSAAGSITETMYEVVSADDNGNGTLALVLKDKNAGSFLDSDKLEAPVSGMLRRGTPNVNKYEKFCAEQPTYLNWKNVLFFVEETRTTMCWSSLYQKWRDLVLGGNMLYEEFFKLDETQKNKQLGKDWQDRFVYQMFWGKGEQYQNESQYDLLEDIDAYLGLTDEAGRSLGVDGGRCVGKRASVVGIYEQMGQCGRIFDAQGGQLNLPALFKEMYNMMRVRKGAQRKNAMNFDVFTDSVTAEKINQAMIKYYTDKSNDRMRFNIPGDGFSTNKTADFGFLYKSYPLFWPQGIVFNVITHEFFDDYLAAAADAGMEDTARVLWVLDFAGIYPGILSTARLTPTTGDLKTLASISAEFACVMATPERQQTLMSTTWTLIVECPKGNLIIEGFNDEVPEYAVETGSYPGTHASQSTTSTMTPWAG